MICNVLYIFLFLKRSTHFCFNKIYLMYFHAMHSHSFIVSLELISFSVRFRQTTLGRRIFPQSAPVILSPRASPFNLSQLPSAAEGFLSRKTRSYRSRSSTLLYPPLYFHYPAAALPRERVIAPRTERKKAYNPLPLPLPSPSPPAEPRYRSQAHIAANGDVYPAYNVRAVQPRLYDTANNCSWYQADIIRPCTAAVRG